MKRLLSTILTITFLFTLTSCNNAKIKKEESSDKTQTISGKAQTVVEEKTGYCEVYIKAVEKLIEEDPALNDGMQYIAIEMNTLKGINKADEAEITRYFEEKYTKVKNASLEDLKRDGEFDESNLYLKNGIAIKIDKISELSEDRISFEASKYKSGLGAIGLRFNFRKSQTIWELTDVGMAWIS